MCRKALISPKCSINISYYFHLWTWRLFQHFPASVLVLRELVLPDLLKNTTKEKRDLSILTDIYFPPGLPWVHACSPRPAAIPIMLHTPTRNLPFISSCLGTAQWWFYLLLLSSHLHSPWQWFQILRCHQTACIPLPSGLHAVLECLSHDFP